MKNGKIILMKNTTYCEAVKDGEIFDAPSGSSRFRSAESPYNIEADPVERGSLYTLGGSIRPGSAESS